jgi:uncharacterized protein YjiS (DUF1127 family)
MTIHSCKASGPSTRGRALQAWFGRAYARWARRRDMRQTLKALNGLPDFALRDIGIHRSEIRGVASFKRLNDRI